MTTPDERQDTRRGWTCIPIRLGPDDRIVARATCWRSTCRASFGPYQTIARLRDGRTVAWCHRRIHDDLGLRVDQWKHGQVAA